MTCKRCGQEIPEGQRFCGHCGADQQAAPQPDPQPDPQPNPQPTAGGTPSASILPPSTGVLILRIFAAVCAVFYGVRAVVRLVSVFTGLVSVVRVLGYRFFGGFMLLLAGPLVFLLLAVVYAWMCVVMVALVLRKDQGGSEPLFLGLCVGGVLTVLLLILRILLLLIGSLSGAVTLRYYNWSGQLVLPIIGTVVAVGGVFLLLYLMGQAPLLGKTADEIKLAA
ncbi:MAG: zinc ribbon domain-containing protein, partial [Oscillospiraceae bacterium]